MRKSLVDLLKDAEAHTGLNESFAGMEGISGGRVDGGGPHVLRAIYPGLLIAGTIALAATWLAQHYGAPVMLFALLLGIAFHFVEGEERYRVGIEFASRSLLRLGVALLGVRITAAQILELGFVPILTILLGTGTTIALGVVLARRMGLTRELGVLSGGAVAICGASAALAIGSVLPRTPERERDTILTVVTVTAFSTVAMVIYPLVAVALQLDGTVTGLFLGGTIHDVAQVVGAGYAVSPLTGDVATYVKLLRVAMLIPVVLCVAFLWNRGAVGGHGEKIRPPLFLGGFVVLVVANSIGVLPEAAIAVASTVSQACLVVAIAALGVRTALKSLFIVGWKPVLLIFAETLWIAVLVLVAVVAL